MEKKNFALFTLTMPNVGSQNGHWSGERDLFNKALRIVSRGKNLYPDLNEKSFFDSGLLIRLASLVNAKHEYEIPDILPIGKSNDYYLKIASDSRKFLKSGNAVSKYILNNIIKK